MSLVGRNQLPVPRLNNFSYRAKETNWNSCWCLGISYVGSQQEAVSHRQQVDMEYVFDPARIYLRVSIRSVGSTASLITSILQMILTTYTMWTVYHSTPKTNTAIPRKHVEKKCCTIWNARQLPFIIQCNFCFRK